MKEPIPYLLKLACVTFTASTLMMASSYADTTAFTISGTGAASPDGAVSTPAATGLVGIEFTVNQNINLTQLGFFADSIGGGDTPHVALINVTATSGLHNPPDVIYDTGNLNNLTNYPAGLTNDQMNYFSVGTPILLSTGITYEIAAPLYFSEQFTAATTTFTPSSAIASVSYLQLGNGGGWVNWDPTNGNPTTVYNYPGQAAQPGAGTTVDISDDFKYTLAVPEPSTYALSGLGGLGLLFVLRHKKRGMGS